MPPPDARRLLAIRLAQGGGTLRRTYELPEPIRVDAHWSSLGSGAGLGLDELSGLLDGPAEDAARLAESDTQTRAGQLLFELLFSDASTFEAVLRALFAVPRGPAPDPAKDPVRIRILTADPAILGLPYRLTISAGRRLIDLGWTFESTHEAALRPGPPSPFDRTFVEARGTARPERLGPAPPSLRNVHLPAPSGDRRPRLLVIAPGVYRGAPLHTEAHVRELRRQLARIGASVDDPESIHVVRTPAGLAQALARLRPEIVYCYGDVDGAGRLALAGSSGGAALVPIADVVAWMRPAPPAAFYLNARLDDATAWRAAVTELAREVPLVVANRTRAWSGEARATAIAWLTHVLSTGGDPVSAIHEKGAPASVYRAAATLCTAYDRWSAEPARPPSRAAVARARAFEAQRAAALRHAYSIVHSRRRRVLALVAPAPPPSFGEPGAQPLLDELALTGGDLHVRSLRVPLRLDPDAPLEGLKTALFEALDVTGTIAEALSRLTTGASRAASVDPAGDRTLVWLDWGTLGDSGQPSSRYLAAWLQLAAEVIAPACPRGVRVIASIALRASATPERLAAWLAEQRDRLEAQGFDHALLPDVGRLDRGDLRALVEAARADTCPDALAEEAAAQIYETTGGDHDAAAALVTKAQETSWAALLRELRGEDAPVIEDAF